MPLLKRRRWHAFGPGSLIGTGMALNPPEPLRNLDGTPTGPLLA